MTLPHLVVFAFELVIGVTVVIAVARNTIIIAFALLFGIVFWTTKLLVWVGDKVALWVQFVREFR